MPLSQCRQTGLELRGICFWLVALAHVQCAHPLMGGALVPGLLLLRLPCSVALDAWQGRPSVVCAKYGVIVSPTDTCAPQMAQGCGFQHRNWACRQ